jgi:hypothetical protein
MALGRLFHYGFDLLAVSTIIAGVKKSTGYAYVSLPCWHIVARNFFNSFTVADYQLSCVTYRPDTKKIESEGVRSVVDSYLSMGDSVFSTISGMAVSSQWFERKL